MRYSLISGSLRVLLDELELQSDEVKGERSCKGVRTSAVTQAARKLEFTKQNFGPSLKILLGMNS